MTLAINRTVVVEADSRYLTQRVLEALDPTKNTPKITDWPSPQDALSWVAANGGEMLVPAGEHVLAAPLTLHKLGVTGRRVILRGQGQSSVLRFVGVEGDFIYAGDPANQGGALGWDIRDLTIRGDSNTAGTGILLSRANSARVNNVRFDTMLDAIRMENTFGVRICDNHAVNLGRDFISVSDRTYHLIARQNSVFNIGGHFLNIVGTQNSLNVICADNDVEVCGGLVKAAGKILGFAWQGNYMEQATGTMFDFADEVRGEITGGNTFQLSGAQTVARFLGDFAGNHLVEVQLSWGANAFPSVGNNAGGANGTVAPSPKRVPVIGTAYMNQGAYDVIGYYKDATGRVHLQGNATRDTNVAAPTFPYTLFNLPAGFRPAGPMTFITQGTTTGSAKIRITVAGDVIIDANSTNDLGLGGISFMAA